MTTTGPATPSLAGHLMILRLDHWTKQILLIPGLVVAWAFFGSELEVGALWWRVPLGALAISVVASSNYVINEVLDAPYDRLHPVKHVRPVPSGLVDVRLAYVQWIGTGLLGLALAVPLGGRFLVVALWLWLMGVVYNVPPLRQKDAVFVDVLIESVNNPIRLLAGWYIAVPDAAPPPASLILAYWTVGGFFMALKRFAELRSIGDAEVAASYRRSFARYTEDLLLVTAMGYSSASMLFFGAFAVRYQIELLLGFPFIAVVMAVYLSIALRPDSPVETPERLYRQRTLMLACVVCAVVLAVLALVEWPWLIDLADPDFPTVKVGR